MFATNSISHRATLCCDDISYKEIAAVLLKARHG